MQTGLIRRAVVDKNACNLAAVEYGQQKPMLDDLLRKSGEDVRQVTSGLLPRADVVAFGDNDHPDAQFTVTWEDASRLAGDALQEEADYDPPRWRHRGWPDSDTLALLRANAVQLPPPG